MAAASFEDDISTVRWEDVTIGALASHMAGTRDCAYIPGRDVHQLEANNSQLQ